MIEEQLDKIYSRDGNIYSLKNREAPPGVSPLYGEMTRFGADRIIKTFPTRFTNRKGVFYDLGSGNGRLVMHVSLKSRLSRVVGVEYYEERVARAKSVSSKIDYPHVAPEFIQGNIFDMDFSDATIVYCDTTVITFAKQVNKQLVPKLPSGCMVIQSSLTWADLSLFVDKPPLCFTAPATYNKEKKLYAVKLK